MSRTYLCQGAAMGAMEAAFGIGDQWMATSVIWIRPKRRDHPLDSDFVDFGDGGFVGRFLHDVFKEKVRGDDKVTRGDDSVGIVG